MHHDLSGSRVLVLGGAGFIGQHLCRDLIRAGANVRCFDLKIPCSNSIVNQPEKTMEWITGDFSDTSKLAKAIEGMDYVFHLISTTIPETSNRELQYDLSSNVFSTLKLLDSMKSSKVKKMLFVSSGGTVYGIPNMIPIPEDHETNPICGYGIHKLAIEKYLYLYNYNFGLDYCILRLSNPYGTAQISDRPQGVIGKFVYKAIRQEAMEIWGDGSVVRDYLCIDDIVDAMLMAMKYRGEKKVFNVGSGTGHSLLDIIHMIERSAGHSVEVDFLPSRKVDVPLNILDIGRIQSELSWAPRTDLQSGIHAMFEYGNAADFSP